MEKILVLSDLHIRVEGKTVAGFDPLTRFRTSLEHALAHHGDASALVLPGDLTDTGKPAEYDRLRTVLDRLRLPVLPMLGNADRRKPFLAAFPEVKRTKSGHVQQIMDLEHHRLITLDTLHDDPVPRDHHAGQLCADRLHWLHKALEGAGGRIPVVFAHHPPMRIGMPFLDSIRLKQGKELLSLLAAHPGAQLICGHVHRAISGSARGVPFTVVKSTSHEHALDLVSETDETVSNGPSGYTLLLLSKRGVIAHGVDLPLPPAAG